MLVKISLTPLLSVKSDKRDKCHFSARRNTNDRICYDKGFAASDKCKKRKNNILYVLDLICTKDESSMVKVQTT